MNRTLAASLVVVLALGVAACENAQPPAYGTAGGPLATPTNPYATSEATRSKQEKGGYYPYPGCPDVAPTGQSADANTTANKQEKAGYYPYPGCPDVAPTSNTR